MKIEDFRPSAFGRDPENGQFRRHLDAKAL
jgi:hypothetical protein